MTGPSSRACPLTEQAVGWALHALEPDEEIQVVRHLPTCADCRAAARDAEAVLSTLGTSVEQVEPPAWLRDELLAAAERTPQRPGPAEPATVPTMSFPAVGPAPDDDRSEPSRRRRRGAPPASAPPSGPGRRSSSRGRRYAAAGLAFIAVVAIGGLGLRTAQLQQENDAQVVQTQTIFDMVAQFDQPGTSHAFLAAQPGATPVAAVMVNGSTQQFVTVGLPANAADRDTYVLWGTGEGAPRALGTFDVRTGQIGPHDVASPTEADTFPGYAISIEPGRTAPASPSTVVASGEVAT